MAASANKERNWFGYILHVPPTTLDMVSLPTLFAFGIVATGGLCLLWKLGFVRFRTGFCHEALPQADMYIRLLRCTEYRITGDSCSIKLVTVPYHLSELDSMRYAALSYTWTKHKRSHTQARTCRQIMVDGGWLTLPENLWDFFLSPSGRSLMEGGIAFFIDAICIDQHSDSEKRCQIPLMSQVYSKAIRTIIWLGTSSAHNRNRAFHLQRPTSLRQLRSQTLQCLISNIYWTRVWIVPELLLSGNIDVCLDDAVIPWASIVSITDWTGIIERVGITPTDSGMTPMVRLVAFKRSWDAARSGHVLRGCCESAKPTLLNFMHQFSQLGCQNDKDRVFALLPLLPKVSLSIDYSSETTFDLLSQVLDHVFSELHEAGRPEQEAREAASFLFFFWPLSGHDQERAATLISKRFELLYPSSLKNPHP